jgi:hypothetical protein
MGGSGMHVRDCAVALLGATCGISGFAVGIAAPPEVCVAIVSAAAGAMAFGGLRLIEDAISMAAATASDEETEPDEADEADEETIALIRARPRPRDPRAATRPMRVSR